MPLPPAPRKRADQARLGLPEDLTPNTVKSRQSDRPTTVSSAKSKKMLVANPLKRAASLTSTHSVKPTDSFQLHELEGTSKNNRTRVKKPNGVRKLFVLDTNVLMHDPMCLFRFEEHDVFLPMVVLEELDNHKKGMTEVARNARQTSRTLDALVSASKESIDQGLALNSTGNIEVSGKLFFQTTPLDDQLPSSLPQGKADNQILGVVQALGNLYAPRQVVLVSKDINMRVKARALGLPAEDYQNDKTLEDGDLLYSGSMALASDFWSKQAKSVESWQSGGQTYYRIGGPVVANMHINQFVYFESPGEPSLYARVTEIRGKTAVMKTLRDFGHIKNAAWGVTSRNREQNFALNMLMDPDIDFVTLTGLSLIHI